jgi:hypothetical protein
MISHIDYSGRGSAPISMTACAPIARILQWVLLILTRPGCRSQLSLPDSRGRPMNRAQPKFVPTDEHVRRIAQAIAKGRPPPFGAAFDRYCESSPREIFAAFNGLAPSLPYPVPISTVSWRTNWQFVSRNGKHRHSACSRLSRRSAVPTGNPHTWRSVKRLPG